MGSVPLSTAKKVFEGADGSLGCVAAMEMGRDELEGDVFGDEKLFEDGRGFVVQFVEL